MTVTARAPAPLCFEVVAAGGELLEDRGNERIVRFESRVGRRTVVSVERVVLDEPARISYSWLEGPLPMVEESIMFQQEDDGWTIMRYRGRYAVAGAWLAAMMTKPRIRRAFRRAIHEHLTAAKHLAEARAARSKVYPQPPAR